MIPCSPFISTNLTSNADQLYTDFNNYVERSTLLSNANIGTIQLTDSKGQTITSDSIGGTFPQKIKEFIKKNKRGLSIISGIFLLLVLIQYKFNVSWVSVELTDRRYLEEKNEALYNGETYIKRYKIVKKKIIGYSLIVALILYLILRFLAKKDKLPPMIKRIIIGEQTIS